PGGRAAREERNGREASGGGGCPHRRESPPVFSVGFFFESRSASCSRLHPTIGASPSTSRKRRWVTRSSCRPGMGPAVPRSCTPAAASLIAGAAKRRSARRWSRKILFCAPGAGFIPSPRARARSNYVCARGCEGNEAFIVGGYRREYWRCPRHSLYYPPQ